MQKELLLIINPYAGQKKANRQLCDILQLFGSYGWECLVHPTKARGDGRDTVAALAGRVSLVVCIGGDGTFNECVDGLLASGADTPLGYIPAGSTNDFANSLKLSKNVLAAAKDIMEGEARKLDVGSFDGRHFTYVASFGAFTKTSYATPQSVKNVLGHAAYVLGGIKEISSLHSYPLTAVLDGRLRVKGDFIFGAVSNSTSVGGVLTLDPKMVDMNDGLFEVLLVKYPKNMSGLAEVIRALTAQDYTSPMLSFHTASKVEITADPSMDWTLDGEFAKGAAELHIENLHSAVRIMVR